MKSRILPGSDRPRRAAKLNRIRAAAHDAIPARRAFALEPREPRLLLAGSVVINEINYNGPVKTNPTEYVELTNPGNAPVDLGGASFTNGIAYTFPSGTMLQPGAFLLVAEN